MKRVPSPSWRILSAALIGVLTASVGLTAEESPRDPDEVANDATEAAPDKRAVPDPSPWDETVAVTAAFDGKTEGPLGAETTVVDPAQATDAPRTLTDVVAEIPGVSQNGQGGMFENFSVRGVSRQRVTQLVSGMRITSERRAGPSTSFIDPLLMGSVEVLRGPATTYHGSGALGGVVQVFPRSFDGGRVSAGYGSSGDERYLVAGTGEHDWSVGAAYRHANNGEAADGTPLNSHFTQYSGTLGWQTKPGPRRYRVLFIPALATDIGKSNTDYPERTTNYPREEHELLKFAVEDASGWEIDAWLHAQELETEVLETDQRSRVLNDSLDWGLRGEKAWTFAAGPALRVGLDGFGRQGVDAEETQVPLVDGIAGDPVVTRSLDGGSELEAGAFAAVRWTWGETMLEAGTRFTRIEQDNGGVPSRDDSAWSGHLGVVAPLGRGWELRGSLGSGVRFPSLTELFYTGTTGRGEVIGNPMLDPERSLNVEAGLRWLGSRLLIEATVFRNDIDDYIERVEIEPWLLTFVNVTSGTLEGLELSGYYMPATDWKIGFGGHAIQGRDDQDRPLADVPPDELFVGGTYEHEAWRIEARLARRDSKDDPADGEKAIPSAELLDVAVGYRLTPGWGIELGGHNLLDEEYYPSADRLAPLAFGRAVSLRLVWQGS